MSGRLTAEELGMIFYHPATAFFSMPAFVFEKLKAAYEENERLREALAKVLAAVDAHDENEVLCLVDGDVRRILEGGAKV